MSADRSDWDAAAGMGESARDWRRRTNRLWRQVAAAVSFALFGISAALLSLVLAPLLRLFVRDPDRRQRLMRVSIRCACGWFWAVMRALRLFDCRVAGAEHLRRDRIIVIANHPTLIDAILLLSLVENAVVIAKSALSRNLFVGPLLRAAGYVVNDDGVAMLDAASLALAQGGRVVIFPESSRTPTDGTIRLRRGAAQLAIRTGCPVVAITIRVSSPLLYKGAAWHQMPLDRPRFDVVVCPAQEIAPFRQSDRPVALAARELNERLQRFYETELSRSGCA